MPKCPKGEKRPADVIGNAVKVMRFATGEENEALTNDGNIIGRRAAFGRNGLVARLAICDAKAKLSKSEREWLNVPSAGREKVAIRRLG